MRIKNIIFTGMVLLISTNFSGCSKESTETEEVIRPVRYLKVERSGKKMVRTFSGVSKAETETNLSFRVGGKILSVGIEIGQHVKKGDLIAKIDTTDMMLQLEEARSSLENARVQQENAGSNLARIRELYEKDNIALREYESAKNQFASAKATYESMQKQLDLRKRQLSYGKLYSPIDGIVADVPVEKNENVTAGELVASLTSGEYIDVDIGIPGAFIHLIGTGMPATVRFATDSVEQFSATVSKVSHVSSTSSTFPVTVRLDKVTEKIRPGMPADVTFIFDSGDSDTRILVPVTSVAEDIRGQFVFLVREGPEKENYTVHRKPVKVGVLTASGFEIREGLNEGDLIVTSGISKITDGMIVRLAE